MRIDLNTDCGESFGPWMMGNDAELMRIVTSANIACGFHAGDPDTLAETIALARANGVALGAHPGYDDKLGFGRRVIPMPPEAVTRMVAYQIGAARAMAALAGGRITHVKAHGALSNHACADRPTAEAIVAAAKAVDPTITVLALATSHLESAAREAGLPVAAEIFADRAYEPNGLLVSRREPGAMIEDPALAGRRMVEMVEAGAIIARDGTRLPTAIDSICVHGDGPQAIAIARTVRAALEGAGITVAPFAGP